MVPGDSRPAYEHQSSARQVLEDAETDLRAWKTSIEPLATSDGPLEERGLDREARQDSESLEGSTNGAQGVSGANDTLSGRGHHEPVSADTVQPEAAIASY